MENNQEEIEQTEKEEIPKEETETSIDYKSKYLQSLADLENTRKRLQKEKQETIRFSIENTLCDFLPIIDNFENALNLSQKAHEEVQSWAMGFQMILTQFRDILHGYGIVAFHSEGNFFDPHFHEAMEIVETKEHPDGMILEEYNKGYKSPKRILRPAQVKVARKPKPFQEEPNEEEIASAVEELKNKEETKQ